jgi:hypothetical protein
MNTKSKKIYEYDLEVNSVTDYGVTLDAVFGEQQSIPLQGARFDLAFSGPLKGQVSGLLRGVDYLIVRADGRRDLDIRATIETEDGKRIAFSADGVATPRRGEPVIDLSVNIRLSTAAESYSWVNARQTWGVGYANLATGKIHVDAYVQ